MPETTVGRGRLPVRVWGRTGLPVRRGAGRLLLVPAVAAALVGASGCGDLAARDEQREDTQSFPFSGPKLTIENSLADLRLVAGASDGVEVQRSLTGKAATGKNANWSLTDGTLKLTITCSGLVLNCGGRHIVKVPPGVTVDVRSDAPVRAVAIPGDLTIKVTDNWIRVEDPSGKLRLTGSGANITVTGSRSAEVTTQVTNGGVDLSFAAAPTRVEARSSTGPVKVTLPAGAETYRVTTASDTGTAKSDVPNDPASPRVINAIAENGNATVRKAG
ncbi:hypothetical protein ACWDV4_11410 [Micromonospora sp. NPDC003197]